MLSVKLEIDAERIATVWLDAPGKRVNTLSRQMWADLAEAIDQIERERLAGIIITSAKPGTFVVGADLFEIRDMSDEEFEAYIKTGQEILKRIEDLPMPSLAAVNGDCLGGGLELALACKQRIAIDADQSIGFPEIRLGLIPGWGGTVRLPRLLDSAGIDLIAEGKILGPAGARVVGIFFSIDFRSENFHKRAGDFLKEMMELHHLLYFTPRHDDVALRRVDELLSQNPIRSPAMQKALEVIREGLAHGSQAGLDAERRAIVELRRTPECQAALKKFFDAQAAKRRSSGN